MPKATPGIPYIIVKGDTLSGIAKQAYGNGARWREIWDANKATLLSGDPNLIYPFEQLVIPTMQPLVVDVEEDSELLPDSDPNDMQIIMNGEQLKLQAGRVMRGMDLGTSGWSATLQWDPTDADQRAFYAPYQYEETKCYIGGQLLVTGPRYTTESVSEKEGERLVLGGYSKTKDIVDSHVDPPYQKNKMLLNQIANEYCAPRGITVVDNTPGLGSFERATASPTDTIFQFLAKLAKQKGVLIGDTPRGYLLIANPQTQFENYGTIGDNLAFGHDYRVKFDGTQRFFSYRAIGKRRGGKKLRETAIDPVIPKSRTFTLSAGDVLNSAELRKAAEWERSKGPTASFTIPFPVSGWYAPNKRLWREANYVTVVSPRLFIPDGFTFLIKSVEYFFDPDGRKCILNLVPPQVFTGEELVEPWL